MCWAPGHGQTLCLGLAGGRPTCARVVQGQGALTKVQGLLWAWRRRSTRNEGLKHPMTG